MAKPRTDSPRWIRKLVHKWYRPLFPQNELYGTEQKITKRTHHVLLLVFVVTCLSCFLVLISFRRVGFRKVVQSSTLRNSVPVPRAKHRSGVEGVGFVLLGLGPYARQRKCEAAIESLRYHGGWTGNVYLLTDAPKCFMESRLWSDCEINATVIDVNNDLSSGFAIPSLYKTKGNRLESKKYKTRIFEFVHDPSIEVLIYLDCDMLISGTQHGIHEFIHEYYHRFNNTVRIFVYPENNPSALNGIVHTGMFIAHRYWSKPVLEQWAQQLDTNLDASDQAAFVRAGIMEYQFIDEMKYLYRPRCDRDDCLLLQPKCFNHINGARCWQQDVNKIQDFIDRWELCTYQHHTYCIPWYMSSFAMSWLPYSSCKKMEATTHIT